MLPRCRTFRQHVSVEMAHLLAEFSGRVGCNVLPRWHIFGQYTFCQDGSSFGRNCHGQCCGLEML